MPQRFQRTRKAGWRAGTAVIVDRSSRYGNPWRIIDDTLVLAPDETTHRLTTPDKARQYASIRYRAWLNGEGPDTWQIGRKVFSRPRVLADLWRLEGRDLACTCPLPEPGQPDHCHASVLRDLADHPEKLTG
jgi:hypothetical protein